MSYILFWPSLSGLICRGMCHAQSLQEKFRDPTSPYHIPPGTQGPESPDPPMEDTESLSPAEEGRTKLLELGFNPDSFWEQQVVWGDHDSFQ